MDMTQPSAQPPRLCDLKSDQIRGPLKSFNHVEVKGRDNENIGRLDGIIIDAAARRMQYFVVEQGFLHRRRYLLPLSPASVDTDMNVLRMDVDETDVSTCERFDPLTYHRYSDEDLIDALFA
jgi:uncharacterized protein YrrD